MVYTEWEYLFESNRISWLGIEMNEKQVLNKV